MLFRSCPGFNHKNDYVRQTPCDQDFLRKFARDTKADRLHAWFNREVPRCLRSLRLFDQEGLFIGDGSYLFVPDNEHYPTGNWTSSIPWRRGWFPAGSTNVPSFMS